MIKRLPWLTELGRVRRNFSMSGSLPALICENEWYSRRSGGELVRQEETRADGEHRRSLERLQLYYKLIAAPVAFGTGVAFVALTPLVGVGLFLIGAGLAAFAPDYVRMVLRNKGAREGES